MFGMLGRNDPRELAAVFVGGALGTLARALLSHYLAVAPGHWPWPTFAVNIVGAFLLGYFTTRLLERLPVFELSPPAARHRALRRAHHFLDHAGGDRRDGRARILGSGRGYTAASVALGLLAVAVATAMVRRVRVRG